MVEIKSHKKMETRRFFFAAYLTVMLLMCSIIFNMEGSSFYMWTNIWWLWLWNIWNWQQPMSIHVF